MKARGKIFTGLLTGDFRELVQYLGAKLKIVYSKEGVIIKTAILRIHLLFQYSTMQVYVH